MHENGVAHPIRVAMRRRWPPMSQVKLARALDMNPSVLGAYLNGRRDPPEGFYIAAAELFGSTPDEMRPREQAAA